MRGTKVGETTKKSKSVLMIAGVMACVLITLTVVISLGFFQQKLTLNSNSINSNAKLDKMTNYSSVDNGESISTTVSTSGSSSSGGGSSGGGSSGGGAMQSQGVQASGAGDPSFSNYWDNSGVLLGAGIARMNVSITGTNGSAGIAINGVNYTVENNNWLVFNGAGSVDYGNNAQFSPAVTGAISFAAIITPSTASRTMSVVSKSADGLGKAEYELQFDSSGNIAFYVYSYYNHPHCSVSMGPADGQSAPYVAGQSYFVYAEYINGTSCSLQVNQQDIITQPAIMNDPAYLPPTQGIADLRLGQKNSTTGNDFYGSIDNFVFYSQSLNPIQINRLYNEWVMGKSIPVLSYHRIFNPQQYGEPPAQEIVNKTNFASQMKFLHDNGYQTITYKQWNDWTNGIGTIPAKPIIIDFDDGWYSVYANAKPVMDSYGYVGVVGAYIDAIYASNGGTLPNSEDVDSMNFAQLKTLSNAGWEIASHSYTHPLDMTIMTTAQRVHEFNDSKNLLQANLNVPISTFIYPFDNDTIVTDAECGTFYTMCSGYTSYPVHFNEPVGDSDFFLFKNTNKIYANGAPMGMRRVSIGNDTSITDLQYYVSYDNNQQINSPFDYSDLGTNVDDRSGQGNYGTIMGATWNNNLYTKSILLNPGVYNYTWWAYDGLGGFDPSNTRSYTVYPPYVVNVSLQITSPTTAVPVSTVSGGNISIYFNFLNSSYTSSKNVTAGISINNITIGGKFAAIVPTPITKTSHTYNASTIFTKSTESINQPPSWSDSWDGSNADSSCYSGAAALDSNYCTISVSGFYPTKNPWARINFTIPEDVNTITSIQVTATARSSSSSSNKRVAFILADFATSSWVEFASRTNSEVTRTVVFTSGISDYVRNGQMVMLIEGAGMTSGDSIGINYASITVNATSSSGKQFVYVPGKGWNVNVTAPNLTDGLQDLFVNATWSSYYG
jgi:peptidoglycan/xylan/chitin deacetylase (PgdA/CDA1 family)